MLSPANVKSRVSPSFHLKTVSQAAISIRQISRLINARQSADNKKYLTISLVAHLSNKNNNNINNSYRFLEM